MKKYENDLSLYDDSLESKVIELLQTEYYQPKDAKILLDTILELRLDDISMQSTVDECFIAIKNLAGIPVLLMNLGSPDESSCREYAIKFFSKAIDVMDDDLISSIDFDSRSEETWNMNEKDYFVNTSDWNYAYAKELIFEMLEEEFPLEEKQNEEVLSLYRGVVSPIFTNIKCITLDGVEFKSLNKAQDYINKEVLDQLCNYNTDISFNLSLVLDEDIYNFDEITLNLNNIYDFDFITQSFIEIVLEYLKDFSRNDLVYMVQSSFFLGIGYEIDLSAYKEKKINTLELDSLYADIFEDIYILLSRYSYKFKHTIQDIKTEDMVNVLSEILSKSYESDMDKLEYEIRIIKLLIARKATVDITPLVRTNKLENPLLDFPLDDEVIYIVYLQLKNIVLNNYRFKNSLYGWLDSRSIVDIIDEEGTTQRPREGLGYISEMLKL